MNVGTSAPGLADLASSLATALDDNVRILPRRNAGAFRQAWDGQVEPPADGLEALLVEVSETSMQEIDRLIDELQLLRQKLQSDSDRIRRDLTAHEAVNEQVLQLTKIIAESVHRLPDA